MRVSKPRQIDEYLEGLADFLNVAHGKVTKKEWQSFLKRIEKNDSMGSYFHSHPIEGKRVRHRDRVTLQEAKDIRAEMHYKALAYLYSDKAIYRDWPYAGLVGCLNDLQLETQYQCQPEKRYGKPLPHQPVLRDNDKRRWIARVWPKATSTKELLYTILAGALVGGTLNRLQVCRACGKYIAVKQRNRRFCPGTNCKDDYFNRQKKDEDFRTTAKLKRENKKLANL
jgi:hypothetical protein